MIYDFKLTQFNPHMSSALIECVYCEPNSALKMGAKFMDLSVDLGSAFAQECPPISFYRLVFREGAFLRTWHVSPGDTCAVGDVLATFSTTPDEPLDQDITRPLRMTVAGIMYHEGMWTGRSQ